MQHGGREEGRERGRSGGHGGQHRRGTIPSPRCFTPRPQDGKPIPGLARHLSVTAEQVIHRRVMARPPTAIEWDADAAVTHLFTAHYRPMVRLASLLLHDRGLAEEIVQDAYVALHGRWRRLRDADKAAGLPAGAGRQPLPLGAAAPQGGRRAPGRRAAAGRRAERRGGGDRPAHPGRGRRGPAQAADPAAGGDRAALLRRPVGGGHRRGHGGEPGRGQEPHQPRRRRPQAQTLGQLS